VIGDILECVCNELSEFIESQVNYSSGKKNVVLLNPRDKKGEVKIPDNTIALSLLNINEDTTMRNPVATKRVEGDKVYTQIPGISIDISIIFMANFPNDYISELNYITKVMEFFQQKDTFTVDNTPSLKKQKKYIDKLNFKLSTTKLEEQHHIWDLLGIKYMPSVVYDVGKILIQDDEVLSQTKVAKRVSRVVRRK
jgi:hypothetical protein